MIYRQSELWNINQTFYCFEKTTECVGKKNFKKLATNGFGLGEVAEPELKYNY